MSLPVNLRLLTEEPYAWGYLYGALLSDGHTEHYRISLTAVDREYVQAFRDAVYTIMGERFPIRPVKKGERGTRNLWRVRVNRLLLAQAVEGAATPGSYTWRIPNSIMRGSPEAQQGFLNGFFDGDGWVSPAGKNMRPVLGFRSVNGDGLRQLATLLRAFGIQHPRLVPTKNGRAGALLLDRIADVRCYLDHIGVTLSRKRVLVERYLDFFELHKRDDFWSEEELRLLKDKYGTVKTSELAHELNRSVSGIKTKSHLLGYQVKHPWTAEEIRYLEQHRGTKIRILAKKFGRTEQAVGRKMSFLNLTTPSFPEWTPEEDDYILHSSDSLRSIAAALGRTRGAVGTRRCNLRKIRGLQ